MPLLMDLIVENLLKQQLDHIHQLHLNLEDLLMLYQNLVLMFVEVLIDENKMIDFVVHVKV